MDEEQNRIITRELINSVVDNIDIADVLIAALAPLQDISPAEIADMKYRRVQAALRAIERAGGILPSINDQIPRDILLETGAFKSRVSDRNAIFRINTGTLKNDRYSIISTELINKGLEAMLLTNDENYVDFKNAVTEHRIKAATVLLTFAKFQAYEFTPAAQAAMAVRKEQQRDARIAATNIARAKNAEIAAAIANSEAAEIANEVLPNRPAIAEVGDPLHPEEVKDGPENNVDSSNASAQIGEALHPVLMIEDPDDINDLPDGDMLPSNLVERRKSFLGWLFQRN